MVAALVQHEPGRSSLVVSFESDLRVDDLQKIIAVAIWKYFDLWLSGGLRKEVIALTGNRQNKTRRQLVTANISVEKLGIDGNLFVFHRRQSLTLNSLRVFIAALVKD